VWSPAGDGMKVFVVGGMPVRSSIGDVEPEHRLLSASMERLGRALVGRGHELLVCSPFQDSADIAAVRGAAMSDQERAAIEFHHPDSEEIREELQRQLAELQLKSVKTFAYVPLVEAAGSRTLSRHAWLLAQLGAMDRSHAVVALGGRDEGSASLLLALAESRRKPVLPLTFLRGAAESSFGRIRYQLQDHLGDAVSAVHDSDRVDEAVTLVEQLTAPAVPKPRLGTPATTFFISYPRSRPEEADFVETVLRRRRFEVYRDERDFGAGKSLPGEISETICRADVFIAVWCREYACSPWCFDELQLALERKKAGGMALWLLCVDDTRIVHPEARPLVSHSSTNRDELERNLLMLLESTNRAV
jgi:hypothetical protein